MGWCDKPWSSWFDQRQKGSREGILLLRWRGANWSCSRALFAAPTCMACPPHFAQVLIVCVVSRASFCSAWSTSDQAWMPTEVATWKRSPAWICFYFETLGCRLALDSRSCARKGIRSSQSASDEGIESIPQKYVVVVSSWDDVRSWGEQCESSAHERLVFTCWSRKQLCVRLRDRCGMPVLELCHWPITVKIVYKNRIVSQSGYNNIRVSWNIDWMYKWRIDLRYWVSDSSIYVGKIILTTCGEFIARPTRSW